MINRDDVSKTTRNYVEGTVLDSDSRKLSSLTVGHEAGLGVPGVRVDAQRREDAPETQ